MTLQELEQIIAQATRGPWSYNDVQSVTTHEGCKGSWWKLNVVEAGHWHFCFVRDAENAQFIAASRQALPALLVVYKQLKEALLNAHGIKTEDYFGMTNDLINDALAACVAFEQDCMGERG